MCEPTRTGSLVRGRLQRDQRANVDAPVERRRHSWRRGVQGHRVENRLTLERPMRHCRVRRTEEVQSPSIVRHGSVRISDTG